MLAWSPQTNLADAAGKTPLHLAVKNFEESQSRRNIKLLLLEGANRHQRDQDGLSPVDLVGQLSNENEREELAGIMQERRGCACLNLRTPLKKVVRNRNTVYMMVALFLGDFAVELVFVYPGMAFVWTILNAALLALVFLFALIAGVMNPGYLEKPIRYKFGHLLQGFPPYELCPVCEVVITNRSRHCAFC